MHSSTHLEFRGNSSKEIVPNLVESGRLRATFELDETASPKRIREFLDYNGPDGPPDPEPIIQMGFYELQGDRLEIRWGNREYPRDFEDPAAKVQVLERDREPVPLTRQPSNTSPILDDILGRLEWDDNIRWYTGRLSLGSESIAVSLIPDKDGNPDSAFSRARSVVARYRQYADRAKDFAVTSLLGLKNGDWLAEDEPDVTPSEFASRITVRSITFRADGSVSWWFDDGDLFLGHSIEVAMKPDDGFGSAVISG